MSSDGHTSQRNGSPSVFRRGSSVRVMVAGGILVAAIGIAYWLLADTGLLDEMTGPAHLQQQIAAFGILGPLGIMGLMTLAVVVAPIPSAPIALAAGALYGHAWGTLYVAAGAELGALAAFGLARMLGYAFITRWLGDRLSVSLMGSQWVMAGIVFVSRLLPFVSFDIVSYAAGLTPLKAWRFAAATLAGILPASFLLAHFGGEMASGDPRRLVVASLVLGGLVLIPILWRLLFKRTRTPQKAV